MVQPNPQDLTPSLVAKLRAGDRGAAELLQELYRNPLTRFCWGYLGNVDEAEDAVQDVFCRVWQSGKSPDNFRAWVYKVARNVCLNLLRTRNRRRDGQQLLSADSWLSDDTVGPLSRVINREQQSRLRELLTALSPAQREALRLRYAERLSRGEIAYVLEVSEKVVKSRLYEAVQKMRGLGLGSQTR